MRKPARTALAEIFQVLQPDGPSARVVIGLYMVVSGLTRTVTGNTYLSVNVFSSRVYGMMLAFGGIFLLATTPQKPRCRWLGRSAAIVCAALWVFIIFDAWGAWVSISGATIFVLALINEVRVHEC